MNTTVLAKNKRTQIAQETLALLQRGCYATKQRQHIPLAEAVEAAVRNSQSYTPEQLQSLRQQERAWQQTASGVIELGHERTMACTQRLVQQESLERVCCLNFASARNPGGGFLNGAQAQEESIARVSALYACQLPQSLYYNANRRTKSCFYTDHLIYSPDVPVLRNADDELLDEPYTLSIITAPAVNAGVVREREPDKTASIETVMLRRMENILCVALEHEHRVLVLGAWGCGVFRNEPQEVARCFASLLGADGRFEKAFERVVFAVHDSSKEQGVYKAFAEVFMQKL